MEEKQQPIKMVNLVQKSGTYNYKIVIPSEVEKKIRFACQQSWNTEWSGTLFFNYEGSFEHNNLVIKCIDIFIMDVGTQGYTEFDMNPDVINYMMEKDLLDCQMGLIHSHNNMSTFFSGTDQATLKEEGTDRNNFVSLIVNNAGTYTAAITRKVKSTKNVKDCYSYEFFGEGVKEHCKEYVSESEEIEWYSLKIEKQGEDAFIQDMAARFAEIKKAKEAKAKAAFSYQSKSSIPSHSSSTPSFNTYIGGKKVTPQVKEPTLFDDIEEDEDIRSYNKSFGVMRDKTAEIPFGQIRFDEDKLRSLLLQLLTCSLIVPNESKIDIKKWATNLPQLYKNRFESEKVFKDWADTYTEFLTWTAKDEDLESLGYENADIQAIVAYDLIEELEKLPQNECIKIYIEELEKYIYL